MRDSDIAYEMILNMLLTGRLKCGQTIDEKSLLSDLKIGKTPYREAINRLSQDGYLNAVPHRGISVVNINVADLKSILELRTVLSESLAGKLIDNCTDKKIEEIETVSEEKYDDPYLHDLNFHKTLSRLSGDVYLSRMLTWLENLSAIALRPIQTANGEDYHEIENHVADEYRNVIAMLREKDKNGLSEVLKKHIPQYILINR